MLIQTAKIFVVVDENGKMWGIGDVSLPFLSGSLWFPAIQIKLLAFPSIQALHCHSSMGEQR